ncbi:MAG TPA: FkbM family methyltransferase [Cyanothece sp. UBA12306]|nr:FkbM family methyltransferase [Cyanothece sp. UBA12306]
MSGFNRFLQKVIKTISGYKLHDCGKDYFALSKDNVEIECLFPGSLLLMEKNACEMEKNKGIYDYLRQLRLKTILEKYQINVVLDVGANIGQFAQDLRKLDYQGRIISFEPLSSAFEVLKEVSDNDSEWEVHQIALGKQNGEKTINIADQSVFTSFLQSNSWCEQQFGQSSVGRGKETVIVRRLDQVLPEKIENIDQARIYLKIDTQGYDLEVFMGLGEIQTMISALQSEISVVPIYQDMPHLINSISLFEKAGFELAGMYPVNYDQSTLRVIEFDCLMVNSNIRK